MCFCIHVEAEKIVPVEDRSRPTIGILSAALVIALIMLVGIAIFCFLKLKRWSF